MLHNDICLFLKYELFKIETADFVDLQLAVARDRNTGSFCGTRYKRSVEVKGLKSPSSRDTSLSNALICHKS
jgi:hypothetical protein